MQNPALRIATGCTRDTYTQHLHDKTKVLPIDSHLKLHATQLKQLIQIHIHTQLKQIFRHTQIHPETQKLQSFISMSTLTSSSQKQT